LRQGFLAIAKANAKRCIIIDASRTEAEVCDSVLKAVEAKLRD
jgi:thymidylate kinase